MIDVLEGSGNLNQRRRGNVVVSGESQKNTWIEKRDIKRTAKGR
jgi:hypothetical protein